MTTVRSNIRSLEIVYFIAHRLRSRIDTLAMVPLYYTSSKILFRDLQRGEKIRYLFRKFAKQTNKGLFSDKQSNDANGRILLLDLINGCHVDS